jgi:hypothetical protein
LKQSGVRRAACPASGGYSAVRRVGGRLVFFDEVRVDEAFFSEIFFSATLLAAASFAADFFALVAADVFGFDFSASMVPRQLRAPQRHS